jgi:neutral ceramidase
MRKLNTNRPRRSAAATITAAVLVCALCFASDGVAVAGEQPDTLRAGIVRKEITPQKPVMLAGYASRKDLSQGVHDPISARVVAFEKDGKKLVLVSTDILGFYGGTAASMRKAIIEACGIQPSELFLSAIHTHGAPIVTLSAEKVHANNVEYTKTLETHLVAAVREALAGMAPAEIAVGSGSSPVGVCRREFVKDADGTTKVQLGRNPSILLDREVQVLRIARPGAAQPAAVIFAYATHSTAMGPGNYLVTGDVHGLAEQFLEKHFEGTIVPGFAGASGNIDPWFRVLPKFNAEKGWTPEVVLMGAMLGEEVAHVLDGIKKPSPSGPIKTAFKTLSLPGKRRADIDAATGGESAEFNLTVGRVGDVAVVGLGGEVFNEIGAAIKKASPFAHTFVITHCNGTAGYLPTKEAYPEGGYEVQSSSFGPEAAEQVVQEALRMLREVQ